MIQIDYNKLKKDIKDILYEYVGINSKTSSKNELLAESFLIDYFDSLKYFKENPGNYGSYKIKDDPYSRGIPWALLKGEGKDTILMIHHYDVVDVEDFGNLKDLAFSPDELEEELKKGKVKISEEAQKDLNSGEYMFGKGATDMKGGGSIQLALLKQYSEMKNFKGNIIVMGVPDEENLSSGMRSAAYLLKELKEKHDLNYVVTLNSEPHQRKDDKVGVISLGSVGKIMTFVYVRGWLSHAGKTFEGLNPLGILSEITSRTETNTVFSDFVMGEASPPPTWLYSKDDKENYDVSMPLSAKGSFSILTLDSEIDEVVDKVLKISEDAFDSVIKKNNEYYKEYLENTNRKFTALPWETKVVTVSELILEAKNDYGEEFKKAYKIKLEDIKDKVQKGNINMIEGSFELVDEIFNYISDPAPTVVIGLTPPFYPNVSNIKFEEKNELITNIAVDIFDFTKKEFNQKYEKEYFFTGISDLSYVSYENSEVGQGILSKEMPLYGDLYSIPLKEIEENSMPCLNIGPWGKDFHKLTERVLKEDVYERTPKILNFTVSKFLE
ncbi:MAG: M20/M25/M40 family metallo-hydrolase [Bacillota bacterium]|nr:M20/M25/M40 family metallo-hydrolase [Bacillota bacterium]